ncbi:MAG: hypothetical protein JWP44_2290 [Mucilaginibacter sp.]|nr:hypothetical protein [Mucilaginibacter sp.]
MKTSNKLLLTAIIITLVSLVFYDLMLKSSYLKGDYKDPFKDYVSLNFKDFKTIDLSASTAANIILKQGPFSVRMDPSAADFVKISQNAGTLHIDAAFSGSFNNPRAAYVLVISCPDLKQFNADARYMAGDQPVIDTLASEDFKWRPSIISGFTLDSLTITEKHAASIILKGNKIRALNAVIGIDNGSRSNMTIADDNQLQSAELNILNKSQLRLNGAAINNLKYQLADSAKLISTGTSQNLIKNNQSKSYHK